MAVIYQVYGISCGTTLSQVLVTDSKTVLLKHNVPTSDVGLATIDFLCLETWLTARGWDTQLVSYGSDTELAAKAASKSYLKRWIRRFYIEVRPSYLKRWIRRFIFKFKGLCTSFNTIAIQYRDISNHESFYALVHTFFKEFLTTS